MWSTSICMWKVCPQETPHILCTVMLQSTNLIFQNDPPFVPYLTESILELPCPIFNRQLNKPGSHFSRLWATHLKCSYHSLGEFLFAPSFQGDDCNYFHIFTIFDWNVAPMCPRVYTIKWVQYSRVERIWIIHGISCWERIKWHLVRRRKTSFWLFSIKELSNAATERGNEKKCWANW